MNTVMELPSALEGEYACLVIDGEEYGVRMSQVHSVVQTPPIRRVPRAPALVAGVAHIGGRIVPLLDPRERFGFSGAAAGDGEGEAAAGQKVVLVQLDHSLYGLLVDAVASISALTGGMIEPVNPLLVEGPTGVVAGMARFGERLIYLLDLEAFIRGGLVPDREQEAAYEIFAARMDQAPERSTETAFRRFLALAIGDEEYGVESRGLRGVVPAAGMEAIAGGPDWVAGIVRTRGSILPVIDLQKKQGLGAIPYPPESRIALIQAGAGAFGLLGHSVRGFLALRDEEIKPVPAAIVQPHIKGVGLLEGGERLVVLLDESRLLGGEEAERLAAREDIEMESREQQPDGEPEAASLPFMAFRVGTATFALALRDLSQVIQYREPTQVPGAPEFIRGILAVGGDLAPVVDLSRRFDLEGEGEGRATRILILSKGAAVYGVVADSVSGVLRVSERDVVPLPAPVQGIDARFVAGMIQREEPSPIVLNAGTLLED